MFDTIKNKIVFLTGASSGIGWACAEIFAQGGARLVITARRESKLFELAEKLKRDFNADVFVQKMDVTDIDEVESVINSLPAKWKGIDILINNAGLALGFEKVQEIDAATWDSMIDTNIKGLLAVTRRITPGMLERGRGHIINLSSIAGHQAYQGGLVYCATKHAVNAITQVMQMEFVATPIRVSAVSPGMVETEFSIVRYRGDKQKADKIYKGIEPLTAKDIAETIFFCASRPPHVNICDIIVTPVNQANVYVVSKKNKRFK